MYNYPELMTGNVVQQGEVSIWVESAQSIEDETLNYAFVGMPPSFKIHIAEGGSCDVVVDDMDIGYGNMCIFGSPNIYQNIEVAQPFL